MCCAAERRLALKERHDTILPHDCAQSALEESHVYHFKHAHKAPQRKSYCLIPNLIPQPCIEAVQLRALEIGQQLTPWPSDYFQVLNPERYRSENDTLLPTGIQRPAS